MMAIIYFYLFNLTDERVKNWPLMSSPFPTLGIVLCYLIIVKLGPWFMEDRKAYEMRALLVFYNIAAMALNLRIGIVVRIDGIIFYF